MFGSFPGQPWSFRPTKLTGPKEPTTLWNQSAVLRPTDKTEIRRADPGAFVGFRPLWERLGWRLAEMFG